ncbi:radical SAM protein [Planctomycetota bacterium]
MLLNALHLLLSYQCTHECDHCFVWASPRAGGTMSLETLLAILDQAQRVDGVADIYFEGGEPFLFYPLLVEGLRQSRERGFSTGVVTNCYWATTKADARLWLKPLKALDVADLSLSSDVFHAGDFEDPRTAFVKEAAQDLGLPRTVIAIQPPAICDPSGTKGEPVVGGSVRFRGRAVTHLATGLPRRPWSELSECPDEDFLNPRRVHVDGHGNVHLCQGLLIGNLLETELKTIADRYDPHGHPVIGPLVDAGPAELVRRHGLVHDDGYVDPCHLCYEARVQLRGRYPKALGPPQVYGATDTPT